MKLVLIPAAVALVLFGTRDTNAEVLRWNLQNVGFTDGATATGFFSLDITHGSLTDFDIKVTGGQYPSFEYTPRKGVAGFWGQLYHPAPTGGSPGAVFSTTSGPMRSLQLVPSQRATHPLNSINNTGSSEPFSDLSYENVGFSGTDLPPRWIRTGSLTIGAPQTPSDILVKWTLDGVKFDDGSTATGSFIYDASAGTVVDFDLHFEGFPFGDANQHFPCQPDNVVLLSDFVTGPCWVAQGLVFSQGYPALPQHLAPLLKLVPERPLRNEGGIVHLSPGVLHGFVVESGSAKGTRDGSTLFALVAGDLVGTVVPESSQALIFAAGLILLLGLRARQKSSSRAPRMLSAGLRRSSIR